MASVIQHDSSSHFPFSLFSSAGLFLTHKAGLAVGPGSTEQWDTIHPPRQGGLAWMYPHGDPTGAERFYTEKKLSDSYTLQTHQAVSSLNVWVTTPPFSITLWADKKPFRDTLSQPCHFNPTDAKVIFILFLLN